MPSLPKLTGLAVMFAAAQLHAQGMNMPMDKPAANMPMEKPAASAASVPFVKAQVSAVDTAKGTVTLNHEDIPNMKMPAMTMAFNVANKKMLKGIKAGDKVRFKLEPVKGKPLVTKLERSK